MQPTSLVAVTRAPFGLQLRPEDAVQHGAWNRACEEAVAALWRGQPVAVLGLPGTGKTFLLQRLTQLLASEGLRTPRFGGWQLAMPQERGDILLVDEADRLPESVLDGLCAGNGPFILAGLPEMARRLADQPRPVAIVMLEPLSPVDVARFVAARLSATGHRRDLFEAEAVLALARHSAGLPRLVATLAGAAMFLGEHEGCGRITKQHVDEAAAMRTIQDEQGAPVAGSRPSSPQIVTSKVGPITGPAKQERHPVPFFRTRRVAPALGGVALLAALGWMLTPRHAPPSIQVQPRREAGLTGPPPVATSSPVTPAPTSAPVVLPDAGRLAPGQPAASVPRPTPVPPTQPTLAFQGSILNETMNQSGKLSLNIRRLGASGVTASFQASAGLIGSGDLTGTMTSDGRLTASGRLMMGRNPFDTTLTAMVVGDRLEGTAVFMRPNASGSARSRFSLVRF